MLIIFFDIKGIVHKEFVLAGKTVNSAYCCEVLRRLCENLQDFFSSIGDKGTGCCITATHGLTVSFSVGNFWKRTT
jgi:hypothetical protein